MKSFILLLILFTVPTVSFGGPKKVFKAYLKNIIEYKNGNNEALKKAGSHFDVSSIETEFQETKGKESALMLINILDRIERVKVDKIPKKIKTNLWVYKKKDILVEGKLTPVEISISKNKEGVWLFSKATVDSLPVYYDSVKNKKLIDGVVEYHSLRDKIKNAAPEWTGRRTFILYNGQWIGLFFLIFIGLIVERFGRYYLAAFVLRMLKRYNIHELDEKKEKRLTFPFGMMALTGFISISIPLLELDIDSLQVVKRLTRIIFTFASVVLAHHLVDIVAMYFEKIAKESENKFDDILVPLIKKTGKFFVIAVGVVAIGDSLSLDMKGILTGLGIGGLAFALAAKDTLSNLFGSLTVLIDRPFRIGDWVTIGNIEGVVEEVGLRSTRVRTFYDSLITVPNGTLTNVHVDNYGQRRARRLSTKIGVQYDTNPKKLEAFCEGIRELIRNHPHTKKEGFHVYFNSMGDFSLNILLYVFFIVPDWSVELKAKHSLYMDILRLGEKMGVEFAFPTQTLHLYNEDKVSNPEPTKSPKELLSDGMSTLKNEKFDPII